MRSDGGLRGATIEIFPATTNLKPFTLKMVTCGCFIFHHLRVLLSTVCEPPPSAAFPREQLSATDLNEVNRCQVVGLLYCSDGFEEAEVLFIALALTMMKITD